MRGWWLWIGCVLACSGGGEQSAATAPREARELGALGYVAHVAHERRPGASGVTFSDAARSAPGINLYCSVRSSRVHVFDTAGESIAGFEAPRIGSARNCLLEPRASGGYLALSAPFLSAVDREGRVAWTREGDFHHDMARSPGGGVSALAEASASLVRDGRSWPVRDARIRTLDAAGETRSELSLLPLVADRISTDALRAGPDVLHANSLMRVDADRGIARAGWWLVCLRELNLIVLIAPPGDGQEEPELRWAWGAEELEGPHHATLLESGRVLVFDNGVRRGFSRILEVEPESGQIVWEYVADPPAAFFSERRGAVQPLAGGNLLITESAAGRVFEIDRAGSVVWEFLNPEFDGEGRRKQIYRLLRWPRRELPSLVGGATTTLARTTGGPS